MERQQLQGRNKSWQQPKQQERRILTRQCLAKLDDQTVGRNEPAREEIERRAYELYLARGEVHGYDQDDWLQAERELKETQR